MFTVKNTHKRIASVAMVGLLSVGMAACSDTEEPANPTPSTGSSQTEDPAPTEEPTEEPMAEGAASQVFGPGCEAVPMDGKGSFDGMVKDPVATAASNNPLLSTLVTAVGEADLVDTLNSADGLTVFAPTNDAFGKIPEADLNALLADKEALTGVLTHHVVAGQLSPEDVAGTHETLAGDQLTVEGSGEDFTIGEASIICGNVPTANATVYIVDSVLMPGM